MKYELHLKIKFKNIYHYLKEITTGLPLSQAQKFNIQLIIISDWNLNNLNARLIHRNCFDYQIVVRKEEVDSKRYIRVQPT